MPNYQLGHIGHFSYFLIDTKDKIELRTFEWWTEQACDVEQFVVLNKFDKKSLKWEEPLKVPEKFENFHGCILSDFSLITNVRYIDYSTFLGSYNYPHPVVPKVQALKYELEGILAEIFAQKGNYKVSRKKTFFDNPHIHRILVPFSELEKYHYGTRYCEEKEIVMIPIPEKYSSFEKMILPFDYLTWTFLITTFCGAFMIILTVDKMLPKFVKQIIFGEKVNAPLVNLVSHFFGIGQTRLPKNNYARIILIFYMFFCLVFRTAYQGVFFEMMTSDVHKRIPETLKELKEKGVVLYTVNNYRTSWTQFMINLIKEDER
jgi:hypothetical protein